MQVAVLIPLMRAHRIAGLVQNIRETTPDCHIVVIAAGECADAAKNLGVSLIVDNGGTWPQRINAGYTVTTEPYIFTGADDLLFHDGWFDAAMKVMNRVDGVVGVNDLYNPATVHFLISRNYIETVGGVIDQPPGVVCCEQYRHAYTDDEIRATAIFHGRWDKALDSVVEHIHVGAGKSPMDSTYVIGEQSAAQGLGIFHSRGHLWQK